MVRSNLGPNTITEPDTFPVTMFLPGGPKTRPLNIYLVETFLLKWSGKVSTNFSNKIFGAATTLHHVRHVSWDF
ncbi:hypothetical protein GLOIN_2v1601410 [Rhizophagus irregularis DAOM 181602=DAOM 197198]|uniref:Uncharacterized protein n=1 Tax=Rhizophagus irregularis (strain DAOM 181602 / DAOM 197198 / MUCL 43194) TaxID=747089 RepID=A0A2P4Q2P7_RHIID|nr:hypothetical protein GLOIN_2v1601410 [Rhizophagus irregularis DAOM 181602=DAOM 197198]POG71927.1 hypothetical protein GLOIN_2v1601410 [Rhizophagus irregularis DAOM 181602=DAOM 197198]|eukprot:XP_025178793.1 hypothetical protein GLOIN_2v1601410 [Rhizophagus irregularis DAOM 181602=DAOM 197198]